MTLSKCMQLNDSHWQPETTVHCRCLSLPFLFLWPSTCIIRPIIYNFSRFEDHFVFGPSSIERPILPSCNPTCHMIRFSNPISPSQMLWYSFPENHHLAGDIGVQAQLHGLIHQTIPPCWEVLIGHVLVPLFLLLHLKDAIEAVEVVLSCPHDLLEAKVPQFAMSMFLFRQKGWVFPWGDWLAWPPCSSISIINSWVTLHEKR